MKYVEMGKLIMVGAGPGDVDLITLKGIKALKKADVVLYDALANAELLQYCKEDCLKIYVGKKAGIHSYQQIYINDMIVDYARQHDTVVRLKGGDPYVFGRGHEEYEHAASNGIEVEVIPGVSSALAAPANCQIPLTKRGVNESFWVITGHTRDGGFSRDMISAAKSSATVVILMGLGNLSKIVSAFSVCRGSKEPIAIIQNGTRPNEKRVVSTLQNIEEEVKGKSISSSPITIIAGDDIDL
ncbi:MAG: uroporphyrinogen-III C-methyltransferase, partial [Bacteroidota bacterium]